MISILLTIVASCICCLLLTIAVISTRSTIQAGTILLCGILAITYLSTNNIVYSINNKNKGKDTALKYIPVQETLYRLKNN